MSDDRRYSEAELRVIIERAAQRQEAARRAQEASEDGLTLAELQQIGAASGIDPAHIASAANELAYTAPAPQPASLAGMPTALRRTRFVPSDISDEAWTRIVAELRSTFDASGTAGEVGHAREWTSQARSKNGGTVHFALEPVEGGTFVTVEQSWRGSAWAFTGVSGGYAFTALTLGTLLLAGQIDSGAGHVPILFALFALVMFGGAQIGTRLYARRQEKRFERALDQIEHIARETPASEAATVREAVRLDLDRLHEEPATAPAASRSRTRT